MTDRIFIDTNILVYTLDNDNAAKQIKAKSILDQFYRDHNFRLSTQVVQEFCNVVLKKIEPSIPEKELSDFIETFPPDQIELINIITITKALSLKDQFKYSVRDCLIIASAITSGCNILFTEDLQDRHRIENLQIINPFN